ncbi:hypothetical protein HZA39_04220 [Candidatus Peregrinibacteria bacterium]|nr:hypothetical protein [Candidatus Peregrinibacteria bacterium]
MPKFSYTVINPEGSTLNGVIDADDEANAREKLNKMEFSIVDIAPISEEEEKAVAEEIKRYEFEGVDKNSRKIKGTIDAADKYTAFKRLVKEYRIEVSTLCAGAQSLEEKEAEKEKGVLDLYTQLKKEDAEASKESKKTLQETEETERKYINEQVNFVLKKVEELQKNFSEILKPEESSSIQKKADRLLRLKASANIPYLEHLCEELLNAIQNKEIYVAQKANDERVEKFNLEIKQMLSDMQRGKTRKGLRLQILENISRWRTNNIENTGEPTFINSFINKFFGIIESWIEEDPRLTEAKNRLALAKQKVKDYQKIYKKEISEEHRKEMLESIKKLRYEEEQIKNEIKELKYFVKEEAIGGAEEESLFNKVIKEFAALTGFLLAFYLLFYVVSEYLFAKNFSVDPSNYIFSVEKSIQFHYLVAILFSANVLLTFKHFYFKKSTAGAIAVFPLILVLSILIIFNF